MKDLRQQLQLTLQGRTCVVGVGNVDYSDDGFGVYLAEELSAAGVADVIIAGTTPEEHLARLADGDFDHVLFIDTADFGHEPGSVAFLDADQMEAAYPQISTHKISLGALATTLEAIGTQVWLLGVQPESLSRGQLLTPKLQVALEVVHDLLRSVRQSNRSSGARKSRVAELVT